MKIKYPEIICEVANSHDGEKENLFQLINQVASFAYPNLSIKFQVFSPNTISLKDYEWYQVYEEITFDEIFWNECIKISKKKIGKVWVDVFDLFGVKVLKENIKNISGIKLQASVLENLEVARALSSLDLKNIVLMLNISGHSLRKIEVLISSFIDLNPQEIILQIGYQAYPTKIEDTGLQKIQEIKKLYDYKVCLADHIDASSEAAIDIPIYGLASGCELLEKHMCLDRKTTKYDNYSSLNSEEFKLMFTKIYNFINSKSGSYISNSEKEYLKNTLQIPISIKDIRSGGLIAQEDLIFRRTSQKGLTYPEIVKKQEKFMFLRKKISAKSTIKSSDFKKARVGVVIAGRLKSSRLKRKAVLPILGKASIQWCIESCLNFSGIDKVILATSNLDEDSELENFLVDDKRVFLYRGDPDDVIKRYIGASVENQIDVIIRVTADCPFVSKEIAKILLESHFDAGADYTAPNKFAVGLNCEVINLAALKQVIHHLGNAELSEYMSWYFKNNSHIFKVNIVDLPPNLVRDYRLTLDYKEDLEMFNLLLNELNGKPITSKNLFEVLDQNPNISKINSHLSLSYKTDEKLINTLNKLTKIKLQDNH
jgi:N,N'-diacetyllegionaminate synthase